MFDSAEFEYADIRLFIRGHYVIGLRGIKYKINQEKEVVYGAGNQPLGIQHGNKSYEGEISLLQSEIEALQGLVEPGQTLMDLQGFDISIVYQNIAIGKLVTDIVKFAVFTEMEKGMMQNDKFAEISLPFIALRIEFNK